MYSVSDRFHALLILDDQNYVQHLAHIVEEIDSIEVFELVSPIYTSYTGGLQNKQKMSVGFNYFQDFFPRLGLLENCKSQACIEET